MGHVTENATSCSFTFGANPCFAGAVYEVRTNGIYIFHSTEKMMPNKIKDFLQEGKI